MRYTVHWMGILPNFCKYQPFEDTEMSMTREDVVNLMKSSKSEAEWNANCDKVKKACGGYPDFYNAVIVSGVLGTTSKNWR